MMRNFLQQEKSCSRSLAQLSNLVFPSTGSESTVMARAFSRRAIHTNKLLDLPSPSSRLMTDTFLSSSNKTKKSALSSSSNAVATSTCNVSSQADDTGSLQKPIPQPTSRNRKKPLVRQRKDPVKLTETARSIFNMLLDNKPRNEIIGIMLNYNQSKTGEPRMVFSFNYVTSNEVDLKRDETMMLVEMKELESTETKIHETNSEKKEDTKNNVQNNLNEQNDNDPSLQPKMLYIHHNAFLKVLGSTIDIDKETMTPILYDREGNVMDPNF